MQQVSGIKRYLALPLLSLLGSNPAFAQEELFNLSLRELADTEVVTASKFAESREHAPIAINVLTSQEMLNAGVTNIPEARPFSDHRNISVHLTVHLNRLYQFMPVRLKTTIEIV